MKQSNGHKEQRKSLAKPKAIICDIDGTLAHMSGRSPYDWSRVGEDELNYPVQDIVNKYFLHGYHGESVTIIIVSGRDEVCKSITLDWLADHDVMFHELFMRPKGNNDSDVVIKRNIYEQNIRDIYDVLFVLDDRDRVVRHGSFYFVQRS